MATFNPLDPFGSLADFMCEGAIEGWKKTASWVLTSGALGDAQWTVANDTLNHVAGVMGFVAVGVGAYSIVKNAIRGRAGEVFASLFATVLAWPLTVVCATLLVRGVSVGDKLTSKILEWNSPAFDEIDLDANVFGDVFGVAFALILALLIVIGGVVMLAMTCVRLFLIILGVGFMPVVTMLIGLDSMRAGLSRYANWILGVILMQPLMAVIMYICVPFGALFKTWGYDFTLTPKWFIQVFERYHGLEAFRDSFVLSLIAAPLTALLSMIISYLVVKRNFRTKGFIEFVSMLAMAVPGTVLGVGFIRGFSAGVFRTGFLQGLYGSAAILVIVFIVRSLPTGTRSGISALRQIDKSIEESAYDMGADSFTVFRTVTRPLIKDSVLSGLVTAFVRSLTAISAIILLVTPQFFLITVQINEFAEKGSYGIACAFATILIAITYGSVLLMNLAIKHFGTSKYTEEA